MEGISQLENQKDDEKTKLSLTSVYDSYRALNRLNALLFYRKQYMEKKENMEKNQNREVVKSLSAPPLSVTSSNAIDFTDLETINNTNSNNIKFSLKELPPVSRDILPTAEERQRLFYVHQSAHLRRARRRGREQQHRRPNSHSHVDPNDKECVEEMACTSSVESIIRSASRTLQKQLTGSDFTSADIAPKTYSTVTSPLLPSTAACVTNTNMNNNNNNNNADGEYSTRFYPFGAPQFRRSDQRQTNNNNGNDNDVDVGYVPLPVSFSSSSEEEEIKREEDDEEDYDYCDPQIEDDTDVNKGKNEYKKDLAVKPMTKELRIKINDESKSLMENKTEKSNINTKEEDEAYDSEVEEIGNIYAEKESPYMSYFFEQEELNEKNIFCDVNYNETNNNNSNNNRIEISCVKFAPQGDSILLGTVQGFILCVPVEENGNSKNNHNNNNNNNEKEKESNKEEEKSDRTAIRNSTPSPTKADPSLHPEKSNPRETQNENARKNRSNSKNNTNNKSILRLDGHADCVTCIAFSSTAAENAMNSNSIHNSHNSNSIVNNSNDSSKNNEMFASSAKDCSIMLWNLCTKTKMRRITSFLYSEGNDSFINSININNNNNGNNKDTIKPNKKAPSFICFMPYNTNYLIVSFEKSNYLSLYNCSTGLEIVQDINNSHGNTTTTTTNHNHNNNNNRTNANNNDHTVPVGSKATDTKTGGTNNNNNNNNNTAYITSLLVEPAYYPFFFTGNSAGGVVMWLARPELRYLQPSLLATLDQPHHTHICDGEVHNAKNTFFNMPTLHDGTTNCRKNSDSDNIDKMNRNYMDAVQYQYQLPRLKIILRLSCEAAAQHYLSTVFSSSSTLTPVQKARTANTDIRAAAYNNLNICRMESQLLNKTQMKNMLRSSPFLFRNNGNNTTNDKERKARIDVEHLTKEACESFLSLGSNNSMLPKRSSHSVSPSATSPEQNQNNNNTSNTGKTKETVNVLHLLSPLVLLITFTNNTVMVVGISNTDSLDAEKKKGKQIEKVRANSNQDTNNNVITSFFSSLFNTAIGDETSSSNANSNHNKNTNNANNSVEMKRKIAQNFLSTIHLIPLCFMDFDCRTNKNDNSINNYTSVLNGCGATLCRDNERFLVFVLPSMHTDRHRVNVHAAVSTFPQKENSVGQTDEKDLSLLGSFSFPNHLCATGSPTAVAADAPPATLVVYGNDNNRHPNGDRIVDVLWGGQHFCTLFLTLRSGLLLRVHRYYLRLPTDKFSRSGRGDRTPSTLRPSSLSLSAALGEPNKGTTAGSPFFAGEDERGEAESKEFMFYAQIAAEEERWFQRVKWEIHHHKAYGDGSRDLEAEEEDHDREEGDSPASDSESVSLDSGSLHSYSEEGSSSLLDSECFEQD